METDPHGPHDAASDATRLRRFRTGFYRCLTSWADATFELCDAALCAPAPVASVPVLSLEPIFRRSHGSLYKALARGGVDAKAMRDLLAEHRPRDWPLVFAVDASTWARCDAETSPERGFYYSASKHSAGKPIVAGWSYSWITQLDWANDSWTAPMDARRIPPKADATDLTVSQVRDLVTRLGQSATTPVFCFDAGYDAIALTHELADVRANIVVADPRRPGLLHRPHPHHRRCYWAAPPPRPPARLRRPKHLAHPRRRVDHHRQPVRHRQGLSLARPAPQTRPPRTLGRPRPVADRGRHRDPGRCAAPAQTHQRDQEDAVAVGRRTRLRTRHLLAGLPATLRHRTHLPVRQEHPGLDRTRTAHPRTSRPLDLARRRRLHPAPPRQRPRRRPPAALGTTTQTRPTYPRPRPKGISSTCPDTGHAGQSTKISNARPRTPKGHPP